MPDFKNSEGAFAEFLDRIGLRWQYETPHGSFKPDFTLLDQSDQQIGVIEVEDAMQTDQDREMTAELMETGTVCRGYDPYAHIERAIKNGSKQLQDVDSSLPCMIVVADILNKPSSDIAVLGAMFGSLSIQIELGSPTSSEPKVVFGKGGKMVDPPQGSRGSIYLMQNQRIGAVAYFKLKPVNAIRAGYFADQRAIAEYYRHQPEVALEALDQSHKHYKMHGISPDEVEPCLEIYINPTSPKPWPVELHGPYDQVTTLAADTQTFQMVFNGLVEPPARLIKRSKVQRQIDELTLDPSLRNE